MVGTHTVQNLETMESRLQGIISKVNDAYSSLNSAVIEIQSAAQEQSISANQQSAAVAQSFAAVEEVREITRQLLALAQQISEAAQATVEISRSGRQAVVDTINSMMEIRSYYEWITQNISALSQKSGQISQINTTVNDIAYQSRMLSLNAAIEAALAGQAGKGFTVISKEMRGLSEQSQQATVQVKIILSEIQSAATKTVKITEEGMLGVDKGIEQAEQARASIEQLTETIDRSARMSTQMAEGGRQQLAGMEQLVSAYDSINRSVGQFLSSTRQTEQAARNLSDLAHSLSESVKGYQEA